MRPKCWSCVHFESMNKKGKIKTSTACSNWTPNWEVLSEELSIVYKLVSKLSQTSFSIFKLYWNDKKITQPFSDEIGKRCGSCIHFVTCKYDPSPDNRPNQFSCQRWNLDLEQKITSKYCQGELNELVRMFANDLLEEKEYPYVTLFLKNQELVNKVKNVEICIGDEVRYKLPDNTVVTLQVKKLTAEHVVLGNERVKISLLYRSLYDSEDVLTKFKQTKRRYLTI